MQHVDEWRSSDCLMAIRLCIFTAHESQCTKNPQQHILILLPPPLCFTLSLSFSCSFSSVFLQMSFSHYVPRTLPLFFHCLSFFLCLDPAPCILSCLIKACIINTAISLSILLLCSYDCYIKCKLFRCNSLLMSLL